MKVVILCGGKGTRLQEATEGVIPKPMVEIGGHPILWHIMKLYAHFHVREFVLCLGHMGKIIKDFFLHYEVLNSDVTIQMGTPGEISYHRSHQDMDWKVTLADTGLETMTGARLARVRDYVGDTTFMLTYGDGVANIDIPCLLAFHRSHGKIATITGVEPISRFGRLTVKDRRVVAFEEKPIGDGGNRINGGFFVFEPEVFDYVSPDPSCTLEREPLERLSADGQLMMFDHHGFWACMDTYRDLLYLQKLWDEGNPPWRLWCD